MSCKNILLILTGGTICSFATSNGEQDTDTGKAQTLIVNNFRSGESKYRSEEYVQFDARSCLNVLSENMTIAHWNVLLDEMKKHDYTLYDGVIILHGTDTLAYTASMLSLLLSGLSVPVILVSSQLALSNPEANGNANFKAAVELIVNGIKPNVYVTYRNDETMYIHYGAHLLQCANHSNNFYSKDMTPISKDEAVFEGRKSKGENPLLMDDKFSCLSANILKIQPYVGLDYNAFSIEGVNAVVHGTYHSGTVATEPCLKGIDCTQYSIMEFSRRCKNCTPPIPIFIEPYEKTTYVTTGDAIRGGILPIEGLTSEMAYVKTLVGCSLGYSGEELYNYIKTNINKEFLD